MRGREGVHGRGHAWQGTCMAGVVGGGEGMHSRGHEWQGGACVAGETATAADGTHPTGMHSCFEFCFTEIDLFIYINDGVPDFRNTSIFGDY